VPFLQKLMYLAIFSRIFGVVFFPQKKFVDFSK